MASVLMQHDVQMSNQETETLTDEQIEALLQEAENRLRQKASQVAPVSVNSALQKHKIVQKLQHGLDQPSYLKVQDGVVQADPNLSVTAEQKKLAEELRPIKTSTQSKKINDVTNAGPEWFNLPKTELTPQLKRDLQMIEMRNVLDPHRHYKKNNRKGKVPNFSQVGTIIEGPTEFFSSRINKKDRSKTFVEEAMKTESQNGRFKRKYSEIQDKKTSGKKGHYKQLMAKRKKS